MNITLRTATTDDLAVLQHWDEQPHIVASDPTDNWGWEQELGKHHDWREQLIAELDGRPIGYVEVIDPFLEEEHYWGEIEPNLRAIDIWIGESCDFGNGYGTIMMKLAIEKCFLNPDVTAIVIDPLASNIDAIRFYKRLGFKFIELKWFDKSDSAVHRLERCDWQM